MKIVKNPCINCHPPQRHEYCHCEGQCAKGDAYKDFAAYSKWINEQRYLNNLKPAKYIKVSPCKRNGNR
jgi:hypothetical protein